jgi:hypothetical protein
MFVNAGEADGLRNGDQGDVIRNGTVVTRIRLERVQPGYANVEPISDPGTSPLNVLDEVYFAPAPPSPREMGRVTSVLDTAFAAEVVDDAVVGRPLKLECSTQETCVGVLVARQGRQAMGVVLSSCGSAPAVGARLMMH